ncbi:MAG: peptide deformylase [Candidatus Buchananbacteria bacterium]|nr:peptide deformylase [Candidatus Buchananbacteria bacterium]
MSRLKIIIKGNPILRKKSTEIAKITPGIKRLILDMVKTMKKDNGIGLAAPQIGQNIRLCLINTAKGPLALINPKITWKSLRKEIEEEGCLSCPDDWGPVKRAKVIYVKALNDKSQPISFRAQGLFARVIQHEVDHLDGILIIDKFEVNKKRGSPR